MTRRDLRPAFGKRDLAFGSRAFVPRVTGTGDQYGRIADAIAQIVAAGPSARKRATLVIPAGDVEFSQPITVPEFTDFVMVDGSRLVYTGTLRDRAVVTAGGLSTGMERGGIYRGINIWTQSTSHHFWPTWAGGTVDLDRFAGFRLRNSDAFELHIRQIEGFPIGLQMFPEPAAATGGLSSVSYGRIAIEDMFLFKIGIDLRGNVGDAFVNQNTFQCGNFTPTSGVTFAGSVYGIRFSREPGLSYSGQNNNVFHAPCFQLAGSLSAANWTPSMAVYPGRRYYFQGRSYISAGNGTTGATGPTHTSGSAADGTATMWYEDDLRRSPLLFDNAGAWTKVIGARRESGLGAAIIIRDPTTVPNTGNATEFEILYGSVVVNSVNPTQGYAGEIEIQKATTAKVPGLNSLVKYVGVKADAIHYQTIGDLHKRAIRGASSWVIPGLRFQTTPVVGSPVSASTSTAALRLCSDGIHVPSWSGAPMVVVPFTAEMAKISAAPIPDAGRTDPPRFRSFPLDANRALLTNRDSDPIQMYCTEGIRTPSEHLVSGSIDDYLTRILMRGSVACRFAAIQFDTGLIQGMRIGFHQTDFTPETTGTAPVATPNLVPAGPRVSMGTPSVGFFETAGEYIANGLFNGTGSPGWYVGTVGVLAPAWVTATAVVATELRVNDGKVYSAQAAGTTGATAPTHASGAVSDGTVTWVYHGPVAALVAAPSV